MLARSAAVMRHEFRIVRRDPLPYVILIVMPLALMAFIKPGVAIVLDSEGYVDASGAEQAVPGMTVVFAFFLVGYVGFNFFRDHGWNTWDRLRASPAGDTAIIVGKVLPIFVAAMVQQALLFGGGSLVFGLDVNGSAIALLLVAGALSVCICAMGAALAAAARTVQQVNAIANVGALVLGGIGGAFTPVAAMPGWIQALAPLTPTYWAMRGYRSVLLDAGGIDSVLLPAGMLLLFAAGFALFARFRFRFDETKVSLA